MKREETDRDDETGRKDETGRNGMKRSNGKDSKLNDRKKEKGKRVLWHGHNEAGSKIAHRMFDIAEHTH